MGWYISKQKLKFEGVEKFSELNLDKWKNIVENDNSLVWFEETPLGIEYFAEPDIPKEQKNTRKNARYDLNRQGNGNVQMNFNLNKSHIWILHTKETLPRIEKYYEIAQKLDANLYKDRTLIDEKKMEQIREKYKSKGGKQAPKEE